MTQPSCNNGRGTSRRLLYPTSTAISGSRRIATPIFARLLIRPNDIVEFATPEGVSRYTVTDIEIVNPSDIHVLANTPGRDLTLVTCYPFYYLGKAPKRWIVHARKVTPAG